MMARGLHTSVLLVSAALSLFFTIRRVDRHVSFTVEMDDSTPKLERLEAPFFR